MRLGIAFSASILVFTTATAASAENPPGYAFERSLPDDPEETGQPSVFTPVIAAANEEAGSAWIPRVKTWTPESVLRVCFYSNLNDLNRFVAMHGKAWNDVEANIRLDFGSSNRPRQCAPGVDAAIRVDYNNQGANFSKYGVDSMVSVYFWDRASMQLDISTVQGPNARSVIIHEFGHALGMFHEHQKPVENGCESEFNWSRVYESSYRYQGWDRAMVDSQFRQITDFYDVALNLEIDRSSVMLYAMNPDEFLSGADSHCYIPYSNSEISLMDAEVLRAAYAPSSWAGYAASVQRDIAGARDSGKTAVARALALYILPKARLDEIAAAYEAEKSLGFNPAPGEAASDQLIDALDGMVAGAQ